MAKALIDTPIGALTVLANDVGIRRSPNYVSTSTVSARHSM